MFGMYSMGDGGEAGECEGVAVEGVSRGPLLGEAERGEMTCCQSELTVTAQCFSAS